MEAQKIINEIAAETAREFNVNIDVNIEKGYPVLINDTKLTERAISLSSDLLGSEKIETLRNKDEF